MRHMSRTEYECRTSILEAELLTIQHELTQPWHDWALMDALYDLEYACHNELQHLTHQYETQDWTFQEWQEWDLMKRNID